MKKINFFFLFLIISFSNSFADDQIDFIKWKKISSNASSLEESVKVSIVGNYNTF